MWTLVDLAESKNEHGDPIGMEQAIMLLKPTRRECEIIARQSSTIANRIREALDNNEFCKLASQTTGLIHPITGKMVGVNFGSDSSFCDFLCWIISQGREVCLQLISDPDSMLPISGNWSLFEKIDYTIANSEFSEHWTIKGDESYLRSLDEYWQATFIHPLIPDYDDYIDTYYEYPVEGFVDRSPNEDSIKKISALKLNRKKYEDSIVMLSTEKSAQKHYKLVDNQLLEN